MPVSDRVMTEFSIEKAREHFEAVYRDVIAGCAKTDGK